MKKEAKKELCNASEYREEMKMAAIDYQYIRPKKALALKTLHEESFEFRENLAVWQGDQATILSARKYENEENLCAGGVIDSSGRFVDLCKTPLFLDNGYPVKNTKYDDSKVVYCGYFVFHWGHFLVDVVPRLWYFLENDETVDKYVFAMQDGSSAICSGNFREFLELLGIWGKLEFINEPTTYRTVIVPESSFCRREYYSPQYLSLFDKVSDNVKTCSDWLATPKVFLSRSLLKKNQEFEIGTEVIDDFFQRNGYLILHPEKISLSKLICYIRNSDVVAAISGTLPHNMLFAKQGQKLEIVERLVLNNEWQPSINRIKDLEVTYIDCNMPVYTTATIGPFILGYNEILQRYAKDKNYSPPDQKYSTEKYLCSCFTRYMKTYIDIYQFQWYMDDWYVPIADYLLEGNKAGQIYFGDYLKRKKPFFFGQYFQLHYIKQYIKRIIGYNTE